MNSYMESQITLKSIHGLARRRYRLFLSVFTLLFLASVVIALTLPPIYKSTTMILIEEQQIPTEYVKSTITTYAEERLQMITRQIMKHSQMRAIIKRYGLYREKVTSGDMVGAVDQLKESITLENISSKQGNKSSTVAFTLSHEGKDPETVQKVTEALAMLYLQEEVKSREKLVSVTTGFLKEELDSLKRQVNIHEERISAFKSEHIGELPENTAMNLQNISRLERELDGLTARIRSLEDRKIYLKGQLSYVEPLNPIKTAQGQVASNPKERLKTLRLDLIRSQARLSETHPDIRKLKAEIAKLEEQVGPTNEAVEKVKLLKDNQARLAELKGRLGDKHPDVKRLTRQVQILSDEVDKILTNNAFARIEEERPDNPAYINLLTQVVSAEAEIKSLKEVKVGINEDLEDLRSKVSSAPVIEKEYKELTLDYTNAKNKYNEMLSKLMTAEVAQQMEEQQIGEKFTILEPAYTPTRPAKPNRLAIILLGFVVAGGAGLGSAAVKEALDQTLKDENELAQITGLPVLTSLSFVKTPEELRAKRLKAAVVVCAIVGVAISALVIVNTFMMPLDELVAEITARL
jgi:succinoglycan biosynthesis transport protein ExoP